MSIFDDEDLKGANPDQDAKDMNSGATLLPVGQYAARLVNVLGKDNGDELHFEVIAGEYVGKKLRDRVITQSENDKAKQRARMIAVRLGVLGKSGEGNEARYTRIPGKSGFRDGIGAYVVIDVIHNVDKDQKTLPKEQQTKVYANLSFVGLLDPQDPKAGPAGEFVMKMRTAAASGQPAHAASAPAASADRFASL
jgi:hypothetical protein